ncbi:MAG TPA: acetyl-CoA carboxylase biotin carboxyl carrier protein [Solirubrobacteraceae bacterium]|nr:acetyl-CoA carboxylase biotin carboxyl carrier protein [Solirubrobacteraceae bacterium]
MGLTDDDVREILRIIDESGADELLIETNGFSLHVLRGAGGGGALSRTPRAVEGVRESAPAPAGPPERPSESENGLVTIPSPMLGTFYRAESPGAQPFVEVGARVEPETTVCIIEVMKMMNSVPAGVSGTVAEVIAENAQLVEYGAPLFRVQPDA